MRGGEGFVKVEEAHVKACFLCPSCTEKSIGIRLIVITNSTRFMNNSCKLLNLWVINSGIFRVCDNKSRCSFRNSRFQFLDIRKPVLVRIKRNNFIAFYGCSSCLRRMGEKWS